MLNDEKDMQSEPSAGAQQAAPVAWCLTLGAVRTFAAELVRGAEAMGDDEDELILEVRSPGTVADDDGALNVRHILALSLAEYPEEGVYPIDPTDPIGGRVDAAPAPSASPAAPEGWRTVMEDLVEELEEQVCYRYQGYPPDDRRFVRDMLTVKEARAMLAVSASPPANPNSPQKDFAGADDKSAEWMRANGYVAPASNKHAECWCHTCRPITMEDMRMVLCPICGNKRCPHASDHRNACTGSNEPGQPGDAYPKVAASPNTTTSQAEGGAA